MKKQIKFRWHSKLWFWEMIYRSIKAKFLILLFLPALGWGQCHVFTTPSCQEAFPGGPNALKSFFLKNTTYRSKGGEDHVLIKFIIDSLGTITNASVLRTGDAGFVKDPKTTSDSTSFSQIEWQTLRLFKRMPKWIPAGYGRDCKYKTCVERRIRVFYYENDVKVKLMQ